MRPLTGGLLVRVQPGELRKGPHTRVFRVEGTVSEPATFCRTFSSSATVAEPSCVVAGRVFSYPIAGRPGDDASLDPAVDLRCRLEERCVLGANPEGDVAAEARSCECALVDIDNDIARRRAEASGERGCMPATGVGSPIQAGDRMAVRTDLEVRTLGGCRS